jgi:two-component system, OmpR family, KDP operon response regulator KdpE
LLAAARCLAARLISGYDRTLEHGPVTDLAKAVLVVEDEELVREVVVRLLSTRGYEVVTAASCAEALKQSGPFDVGIFDIGLGDGCGIELAAGLLHHGKVGRAIFYTSGADSGRITRAGKLGILVGKGSGMDLLLRAAWVGRRRRVGSRRCRALNASASMNTDIRGA